MKNNHPVQIMPFENRDQYLEWLNNNCGQCDKRNLTPEKNMKCDLLFHLDLSRYFTGKISIKDYDRMGASTGSCSELIERQGDYLHFDCNSFPVNRFEAA